VSAFRPTWAEVDLGAIRHNVGVVSDAVGPSEVMAVVKADAYGHGAVPVARAALEAGATSLGVALVEEGVELREAGIDAPILVLSEPPADAAAEVVAHRLTPVLYTDAGVDLMAKAVADVGRGALAVHVKVDTGMHRVGVRPEAVVGLFERIADHPELAPAGLCTHFAVADEPERPETRRQLERFADVRRTVAAHGLPGLRIHAANSAAAIGFPEARFDLVRVGIALYGIEPAPGIGSDLGLRPAMALRSRVSHVQRLAAGERLSYGLRYRLDRDATVATVPIGYADGVPRNLGAAGAEVVIRGVRCPVAGTVTMDQLMVDVGTLSVDVGDQVTLLGTEGDASVTAAEWAERLGTIGYEIVCGIGPRVRREYR
jgi:alanine racemase